MTRLRTLPLVAAIGTIGLLLLLVGGHTFATTQPDVSCDAPLPSLTAWAAGGDAKTDEGDRMVECGRLIGLTEADAEQLLGPALQEDGDPTWSLGPDGLGIDTMFLGVTLEDGRITAAHVYQG